MSEPHRTMDPLVAFLYLLLRDHMPAGRVEAMLDDVLGVEPERAPPGVRRLRTGADVVWSLSNPHTAAHAEEIAARLASRQHPPRRG